MQPDWRTIGTFDSDPNGKEASLRPPLIIIGMHRSGTSLLTRLLDELGLFTGADWDAENSESMFFQGVNDEVLHAAGARWYRPSPMRATLFEQARCGEWAGRLAVMCASKNAARYTGVRDQRPLGGLPHPWGWKDPRNTLTLPLWLRVFPQAKVLHVVRNGVDVAQSLVERDRRLSARPWVRFKRKIIRPMVPESWRPSQPRVCTTLAAAFELWAEYLEFAAEVTRSLPSGRLLEFRFEDFVAAPEALLLSIANFAALDVRAEQVRRVATSINHSRSYAFRENPRLRAFHQATRNNPLMQLHSYNELTEPLTPPAESMFDSSPTARAIEGRSAVARRVDTVLEHDHKFL